MISEVNYLAILVATIAGMAIGALWYGPVFGKYWMKLAGINPEGMKSMPLSPWQAMGLGLVTMFVTNWAVAQFVALAGIVDVATVLGLVGLIWFGFYFTTSAGVWLWEGKSWKLWLFNSVQYLLSLSVAGCIIVLFQ